MFERRDEPSEDELSHGLFDGGDEGTGEGTSKVGVEDDGGDFAREDL